MVTLEENRVVEKGRLGPGQMIAIDLHSGKLLRDEELKAEIAREANYGALVAGFRGIDDLPETPDTANPQFDAEELTREIRQRMASELGLVPVKPSLPSITRPFSGA